MIGVGKPFEGVAAWVACTDGPIFGVDRTKVSVVGMRPNVRRLSWWREAWNRLWLAWRALRRGE